MQSAERKHLSIIKTNVRRVRLIMFGEDWSGQFGTAGEQLRHMADEMKVLHICCTDLVLPLPAGNADAWGRSDAASEDNYYYYCNLARTNKNKNLTGRVGG